MPLTFPHASRESKAAAATVAHEKQKRQPKYIGNLLKQAHMRSVESDRIFERKLQKEREEQDKVRWVSLYGQVSLRDSHVFDYHMIYY